MGNFFRKQGDQSKSVNKDLILFLKQKRMIEIGEAIQFIKDFYPSHSCFTSEQFIDIWGGFLNQHVEDVFLLFQNEHKMEGIVDLYECLATFVILCDQEYDERVTFIFQLFDFDRSEEIEKNELIMSNQAVIRGLCKLTGLVAPSISELEEYSLQIFTKVDLDQGGTISLKEFLVWVKSQWELQDFFLKYCDINTFENAERRFIQMKSFFFSLFDAISGGKLVVSVEITKNVLRKEMKGISDDDFDNLINMMVVTSQVSDKSIAANHINSPSFKDIMNAWSAFSSCDINEDNEISLTQLKFMLYVYEGDIPDFWRIQNEMKIIDTDQSGKISRQQWLKYLCIDPSHTSQAAFRGNLKILFNQFDQDNNGSLDSNELQNLVKENMKQYTKRYEAKGGKELAEFQKMIDDIATAVMDELNADGDQTLNWTQFRGYMQKAYSHQKELMDFLDRYK